MSLPLLKNIIFKNVENTEELLKKVSNENPDNHYIYYKGYSLEAELAHVKTHYAKCQVLINKLLLCLYQKVLDNMSKHSECNKAYDNFVIYLCNFSRSFVGNIKDISTKLNECVVLIYTLCDVVETFDIIKVPHVNKIITSLYRTEPDTLDAIYIKNCIIPLCVLVPLIHAINGSRPTNMADDLAENNKYINPYLLDGEFSLCHVTKYPELEEHSELIYVYTPSKSLMNFSFYEFNNIVSNETAGYRLFSNYNWSGKTLNNIIAFFASFYEKSLYTNKETLYKLCYDFIYCVDLKCLCKKHRAEKETTVCSNSFIGLLKNLNIHQNLMIDAKIFSKFLIFSGIPNADAITNFLTKSPSEITANESMLFKESTFNSMKFIMADEDTKTTNEEEDTNKDEDTQTEETPEESVTDDLDEVDDQADTLDDADPNEDSGGEEDDDSSNMYEDDSTDNDIASDDNSMSEGSSDIEKKELTQDDFLEAKNPFNVLIELGNKSNLPDYFYKQEIIKTIENLLVTQPKGISAQKLLFLKKWLTQWINLLSMKSIKDFVNKLSIEI